ncbi:MAG: (Fe-S)-binding protein [Candidatus Methanofastidiosia archaeon]
MLTCEVTEGVPDCTSCKLCFSTCPSELKLEDVLRYRRYLHEPKGSHRDVFRLANKLVAQTDISGWIKDVKTNPDSDIVYFPGCAPVFDVLLMRDTNYSGAAQAAVKVMNKLGIEPAVVYGCCGHDLYYSGALDEFEAIKEKLIKKLEGKKVVAGCAECYHMLKNVYNVDVQHFSEFLTEKCPDIPALDVKTTYHDPCRLGRYNEVYDSPRAIIEKASDFTEMEHSKEDATCCGVSSWLNCNMESKKMREERIKEAVDTGADILVTSCTKCGIHLDCIYHEKLYEGDPPTVKIMDIQELAGYALGVYDPYSEEKSFVIEHTDSTRLPGFDIEKDPERHLTDDIFENTFQCTLCKTCTERCPYDLEIYEIVKDARKDLVNLGHFIEGHKIMKDTVEEYGNIYGEEPPEIGRRKENPEYALFVGCVGTYREQETAEKILDLLDTLGVDYSRVDEVCCGGVFPDVGFEASNKHAQQNIENLQKTNAKKVLCTCPKCYRTFKDDPRYKDLGMEVVHVVELLSQFDFDKITDKTVTYHDPCDLGRHSGIYEQPRKILNQIAPNFVEMPRNKELAKCCGAGGGVRGAYGVKSVKIARDRVAEANDTADILLTECFSCLHNFKNAKKRKQKLEIYSLSEFILDALEGETTNESH